MDKFDEYLKNKAKSEKENFILPESFNNKIENVINELDDTKRIKKTYNKKILATAASIAIIFMIGKSIFDLNNNDTTKSTGDVARGRNIERSLDESTEQSEDTLEKSSINIINDIANNQITKIVVDNKEISDVNKINEIIKYINNMNVQASEKINVSEWQVSIRLEGTKNYNLEVNDIYMKINDETFICDKDELANLINIIKG